MTTKYPMRATDWFDPKEIGNKREAEILTLDISPSRSSENGKKMRGGEISICINRRTIGDTMLLSLPLKHAEAFAERFNAALKRLKEKTTR